jgi:hypothetical protein
VRVQIWLRRAAARVDCLVCGCTSRAGWLTGTDAIACGAVVVALAVPGNSGQVAGAVKMALPGEASIIVANMRADIAQWCSPWRRQHAGRLASSLAPSVAARGPKPNKKISEMDSARRICNSWYMNSWFLILTLERSARMEHPARGGLWRSRDWIAQEMEQAGPCRQVSSGYSVEEQGPGTRGLGTRDLGIRD